MEILDAVDKLAASMKDLQDLQLAITNTLNGANVAMAEVRELVNVVSKESNVLLTNISVGLDHIAMIEGIERDELSKEINERIKEFNDGYEQLTVKALGENTGEK